MTRSLQERLDEILPRVTDAAFLSNEGIGNEIACYIFDYDAQEEPQVRAHLEFMLHRLASHHASLKVLHLNLLDLIVELLRARNLFDKSMQMQATKSAEATLKAMKGPLAAEKVRDFIAATYDPASYDLILISGVGSAWPVLRAHSLLNCLHTVTHHTPLVMFYPGSFDGKTLRLFGTIVAGAERPGADPYYRAFNLVPRGHES